MSSASIVISAKNSGSIWYFTLRQLFLGGGIGIIGLLVTSRIPYRFWKKCALPLMVVSFVLLAILFFPQFGYSAGGARRWLTLGPVNFQPSEILKLSFVMYLASWLDSRRQQVRSVSYGMIPFAVMLAVVSMFLVMQPDVGTLGAMVITSGILYFLGGGKVSQIAALASFGAVLLYFLIQMAPYRLSRIIVFLNPNTDPQGIGYQISQALIAIGSGGFWGRGFGRGLQKYNYLPEPMGDSIFAIFGEELGFLGSLLIIGAFSLFLWRGLTVAKHAPDVFGKLLAAGITVSITIQAFINMAAISGLMPLTGIPLPFVSYGGTSLAITLTSVGILLNISKARN